METSPWRKRLVVRLLLVVSQVRVSVTPWVFRGGRNGDLVGFPRGSSRFPLPQISFHHFPTLISFNSFHFIPSLTVRQVWSAGILAKHRSSIKGLHRISFFDSTLYQTRIEDIYIFCLFCFGFETPLIVLWDFECNT